MRSSAETQSPEGLSARALHPALRLRHYGTQDFSTPARRHSGTSEGYALGDSGAGA